MKACVRTFLVSLLFGLLGGLSVQSSPVPVTLALGGAHCQECAGQLQKTLGAVKGVDLGEAQITPGRAPEHRSNRFQISLDPAVTEIGGVAKAIAQSPTPHRAQAAPETFLLLPWTATLLRANAERFRPVAREIAGVDGAGSFAGGIYVWVKLQGSGEAKLEPIFARLSEARIIDHPSQKAKGESGGWITDYELGVKMGRELDKPLFVVFR